MTKLDPIIAVKDAEASATWYRDIFGFNNVHVDKYFAVLTTQENEIVLCLHAWELDGHPTMTNPNITVGNGLLLYFRTADWQQIRNNLEKSVGRLKKTFIKTPIPISRNFLSVIPTVISSP
ncbi:hypothetical protein LVJ85_04860 [Neisseria sp. Dent CA1/247]|uniref:hypothetical protein n=1 Tax=Neisseria sp. Dent CA1/247 TaxID=2912675 RepID=UPI001FD4A423|nr:hypothetical protein [Neisseria sp. Dent CA1/247]UOO77800.1 hypothetical protein LVJ85_04860 [Neisseria sp. Dent CA1/247]